MRTRRTIVSTLAAGIISVGAVAAAAPAMAHDHLFNGATSNGADNRGVTNPVAGNPSGVSGGKAQPGTVPGLGNPDAGRDQGTPAFDCEVLLVRLDARSNGVGPSCE